MITLSPDEYAEGARLWLEIQRTLPQSQIGRQLTESWHGWCMRHGAALMAGAALQAGVTAPAGLDAPRATSAVMDGFHCPVCRHEVAPPGGYCYECTTGG